MSLSKSWSVREGGGNRRSKAMFSGTLVMSSLLRKNGFDW